MRVFFVVQVLVVNFYRGRLGSDHIILRMVYCHSICRSSLQISFRMYSRLTVFLTEGKIVFHVSMLSLVCLVNGYTYGLYSYGQASKYLPFHTYYVTFLVFVCLCVCTTLAMGSCWFSPRASFRRVKRSATLYITLPWVGIPVRAPIISDGSIVTRCLRFTI